MLKPRLHKLTSSGFGLIEVVVAAGIMGVIALAMATMFEFSLKSQSGIEGRLAGVDVQREIDGFLNNQQTCTRTFGSTSSSAANIKSFPLSVLKLYTGTGSQSYLLTDPATSGPLYGDNKIRLDEMTLQNFVHLSNNRGVADLVLHLSQTKNVTGSQKFAPKTIKLKIELATDFDPTPGADNIISSCQSMTFDSLWTMNPGGNIYYNGGSVGIGTTAPTAKLSVVDTVAGNHQFLLKNLSNNYTSYSTIRVESFSTFNEWRAYPSAAQMQTNAPIYEIRNIIGDIRFATSNIERMRIDSAGRVAIGKTSPEEALDVSGNVQATAFYYSSDRNLKKEIQYLSSQETLDKILKLNAASYKWRSSGEPSIGLIAQDVQTVFPSLVHESASHQLSVNYSGLTALTIQAVKALNERNRNLEKKLIEINQNQELLESKIEILLKKINNSARPGADQHTGEHDAQISHCD